jgi:hypothetical protein
LSSSSGGQGITAATLQLVSLLTGLLGTRADGPVCAI